MFNGLTRLKCNLVEDLRPGVQVVVPAAVIQSKIL
jgi:hypothetical protein